MNRFNLLILVVIFLIVSTSNLVKARTFLYEDDFETGAAMYDSYTHSGFVDFWDIPDLIIMSGALYYTPADLYPWWDGRRLGFIQGFLVDAFAGLGYQTIPSQGYPITGSISFDISGSTFGSNGTMYIYGSINRSNWLLLGQISSGSIFFPIYYNLAIEEDDPIHFIYFEVAGGASIDNLQIDIDYVIPLTVTRPNRNVAAGSAYTIRWETEYPIADVNIEYTIDNGSSWESLGVVSNTGNYKWNPVPMVESGQCHVRITDNANPSFTDTSETFTIFQCQGALTTDFNNDCYVDVQDYSILMAQWYQTPGSPSADIAPGGGDDFVDELDLARFLEEWSLCCWP